MLPNRILHELRRRPVLRRALSLAGYVGGGAALVYGTFAFWSHDLNAAMASGWWLVGGPTVMGVTHEIREAIRNLPPHTPDPSNPTTA